MRIHWKRSAKYLIVLCVALLLLMCWVWRSNDTWPELQNKLPSFPLGAHEVPFLAKLNVNRATYETRLKRYVAYKQSESSRTGPGEQGIGVKLTDEENSRYDKMFAKEAFNKIASDKMSLERSLRDMRPYQCRALQYPLDMPTASVIIIFHNEAWSPLLRTVYSVINRSPPRYLREIVLLDDASTREELLAPLDQYVSKHWPEGLVRIVRKKERQGLIRARLEGAKASFGDVVIFLDCHCEATEGWLEPLLARIKENRRAVLCPSIAVISNTDLSFAGGGGVTAVGSFWWSLHFTWDSIPESEHRTKETDPVRSPTMAGGLFAMDRKYFFELGGYDEGMEIWGGENLEISFRVWMCGGVLEFIPCSTVGHIFRASHPYGFPSQKDYHGINSMRLAEVWMDDYKELFYMHRRDLQLQNPGDLSSRKALRKSLKCKSFQWYLDNVIPQKFIPHKKVRAYGFVRNPVTNMCLDLLGQNEFDRNLLKAGAYTCQGGASGAQIFSLTHGGEVRREWGCLEAGRSDPLTFITCRGSESQKWKYSQKNKRLENQATGRCIDAKLAKNGETMPMAPCSDSPTQIFEFEHLVDDRPQ